MTFQFDLAKLTLQDALDLAVLIEQEAETRYRLFAEQLGERYPGDATDFFSMMARNEQRHGAELAERRRRIFGDAPSRVNAGMIEDVEAPEIDKPRPCMSPRRAMDVAMASEVKAYEFFDLALPRIADEEVRRLFEELRGEEAEHQRLLEEHMAKFPDTPEPDLDADEIDTPAL